MKRFHLLGVLLAAVAIGGLVGGTFDKAIAAEPVSRGVADARHSGFEYAGFHFPTQLVFQADAAVVGDRARLTPSAAGKVGAIWHATREQVQAGFATEFQFQISQRVPRGADGLAFVIQNRQTPMVGPSGWQMGIGGGTNVFAVKFDNYHWRGKSYVRYDEVAVFAGTVPSAGKWGPPAIASVTNEVLFSDDKVHTARVVYVPGDLRVFLDDLNRPLIAVGIDLDRLLNLEGTPAWVGLTAATGAEFQNHDVLAWSLVAAATGPPQLVARGAPAIAPRLPSGPRLYAGSSEASILPKDAAFGYALPPSIALNYRMEASADLEHWTALTNLVLYFKDPDSTNFNQRFYRFLPK